jgi:hypothetical protein
VGEAYKPDTGFGIGTNTRACLEMNTHMGTLDYFIKDNYIKGRVVNVLKGMEFDILFIIYFYLLI